MRSTALACLILSPSTLAQDTIPYRSLDHIQGAHTTFATFPVTPMVVAPALGTRAEALWVVNHHEHLVERFPAPGSVSSSGGTPPTPVGSNLAVPVPMSPVSVAYWPGEGGSPDEILVVTKGTWGVTRIDATTGQLRGFLHVDTTGAVAAGTRVPGSPNGVPVGHGAMAEPSDIVVDPVTDMAYVSCTGSDAVLQFDLVTGALVQSFDPTAFPTMRLKSPVYLCAPPVGSPAGAPDILVAPLTSGNGTTTSKREQLANVEIVAAALPDEDLFAITGAAAGSSAGSVTVAGTDHGTILFDHGINPQTKHHWQLMTEALNLGAGQESEPELKGRFASNRIVFSDVGLGSSGAISTLVLDEVVGTGEDPTAFQYATAGDVVGQPCALAFDDLGNGYVAGMLSDNVARVAPSGVYGAQWTVSLGTDVHRAIPRGLLAGTSVNGSSFVAVYCWGLNEVRVFDGAEVGTGQLAQRFALEADTTPEQLQKGRDHFFNGDLSGNGALACTTCHVDGGSDLIGWDLSNAPIESKGVMVTQTLVGIEPDGPFHWRGEREFSHFRGAFHALLGAPPQAPDGEGISEAAFNEMRNYLFSLANPANPHQHRRRLVDRRVLNEYMADFPATPTDCEPGTTWPQGDAHIGQDIFFAEGEYDKFPIFGPFSCNDCHEAPTGNRGEAIFVNFADRQPVNMNTKTAPLAELWRKDMPGVQATLSSGATELRPFLGFSVAHPGSFVGVIDFVEDVASGSISQELDDSMGRKLVWKCTNGNGTTVFPTSFFFRSSVLGLVTQWDQGIAPAAHFGIVLEPDPNEMASVNEIMRYLLVQAFPDPMTTNGSASVPNCDVVAIGDADVGGVRVQKRWVFDTSAFSTGAPISQMTMISTSAFVSESGESRSFLDFFNSRGAGETYLFMGLPPGAGRRFAIDRDQDWTLDGSDADPRDPAVGGSLPVTAPTFTVPPSVDWVSGDRARITFETDVPTRALVRAHDNATNTSVAAKLTPAYSTRHSIVLDGLLTSTASLSDPASSEMIEHRISVQVASASSAWTSPIDIFFDSGTFIEPISTPASFYSDGTFVPLGFHQSVKIVASDLALDYSTLANSAVEFDLDVTFDMVRGGASVVPQECWVVGRLLVRPSETVNGQLVPAGPAYQVPAVDIVPGTALVFDEVELVDTPQVLLRDADDGASPIYAFLASPVASSGGDLTMRFGVDDEVIGALSTGDELIFSIDAVVPVSVAAVPVASAAELELHDVQRLLANWSFPATGEALAAPACVLP